MTENQYKNLYKYRQDNVLKMRKDASILASALKFYKSNPVLFISHWVDTYDPRRAGEGFSRQIPFILFERQVELVEFLHEMMVNNRNGLVEKSRDMGATWVACAFSIWVLLFIEGASVGWGSRKEQLVDRLGDPDSIFEKMRMILRTLPPFFLPVGFNDKRDMSFMKIINRHNGSTITGEAGDNIGRGGRKSIYFKDESAHYERPERIEAALSDNTNVQIDISSVSGYGNIFHKRREAGVEWVKGKSVSNKTNVFILDWSDHPAKTKEWFAQRRRKSEEEGLQHVFRQEVCRDYGAGVENTIILPEWVDAAVDAHKVLKLEGDGGWVGGLDVADGGGDKNAFALRKGVVLREVYEWGERDTGVSARKAVGMCANREGVYVNYDSIGVGAGIKAEVNRLGDEGTLPRGVEFVGWDAASSPLWKDENFVKHDKNTPKNGDFFANLKAQGWWLLRLRFEKTWRAVYQFSSYDEDELISISSDMPLLRSIKKELCQPTYSYNSRMKLLVDKAPKGFTSPNLGDAIMMSYHYIPIKNDTVSLIEKPSILRNY